MKIHLRTLIRQSANVLLKQCFAAVFAAFFAAVHANAAIVGPAGYANTFSVQPPATDWATLSVAGAPTDTYDADTAVKALGGVNGTTIPDAGNPPASNGSAVWSSTGLYLQTRPTGNRATVLMGRFVGDPEPRGLCQRLADQRAR